MHTCQSHSVCWRTGFGHMHFGYTSAVAAAAARVSRMPASPATETLWRPPSDLLQPVSLTSCGNGLQGPGRCQPSICSPRNPPTPGSHDSRCISARTLSLPLLFPDSQHTTLTPSNDMCCCVQCRLPTTGLAAPSSHQLVTYFKALTSRYFAHDIALLSYRIQVNSTWDHACSPPT